MVHAGRNHVRRTAFGACLVLIALAAATTSQVHAGYEEHRTLDADTLVVRNLIGEVRIAGHDGSAFEVRIRIEGRDATDAAGLEILSTDEPQGELTIRFPQADKFVYPRLGRGSRTRLSPERGQRGWLGQLLGGLLGNSITVSGSGRGLEIWADLEIKVPAGRSLQLYHGVGTVEAEGLRSALSLDVRSGHVRAARIGGELRIDTGSGHAEVADVEGGLTIDTGSGHVDVRDARGSKAHIDTGSGHVEIDGADFPKIVIDTGSGHVEALGVRTDSMSVDTGSGSVRLELERMGSGEFEIDTGSGGVTLEIPRGASIDVVAETGAGGIDLDLEGGVELRRKERDEVAFRLGGGDARVRIDTGSGGIRFAYVD